MKFGGGVAPDAGADAADVAGEPYGVAAGTPTRTCWCRWRATTRRTPTRSTSTAIVTDTMSLDRLTITGGVRFDHQTSSLGAASVPAVAGIRPCCRRSARRRSSNVFVWNKRDAAHRLHARARRGAQDGRPRQLRDVRVAAAGRRGGVRLADSVRLRVLQRAWTGTATASLS